MTIPELTTAIAEARAKGHEHMILTVASKRRGPGGPGRMWRGGPKCRFVGEVEGKPGRWLVDVKIDDLESWLKGLDMVADPATESGAP